MSGKPYLFLHYSLVISRRVPHPCEPGPTTGFFLLNESFSCNCSCLRGQPLGFCNAPRENLDLNRCHINKVELNWTELNSIEYQFVSCLDAVMYQSDKRKPHIFFRVETRTQLFQIWYHIFFPEVPAKKEVFSLCCVPQRVHAPRAGWGHPVWG